MHNGCSGASPGLGEQRLLPLAFLLAFDQVQPLLLDGFSGEDKATVVVRDIKIVWRRERRGAGWGGSVGLPLLCLCPQEEPAAPIGGGHWQSQALAVKKIHSQVVLKTRLSPLAPQHPPLLLWCFYAPQATICLQSPTCTQKTSTMLKGLEPSAVSPNACSNSWVGLCWDSGRWARTARNARRQGLAGAVAVGCVPFPTLEPHARVLQGNLPVPWIGHEGFLQQLPDLHKSL